MAPYMKATQETNTYSRNSYYYCLLGCHEIRYKFTSVLEENAAIIFTIDGQSTFLKCLKVHQNTHDHIPEDSKPKY